MQDKEVESVGKGKLAELAYEFSVPFLDEAERAAISEMKQAMRAGSVTFDFLMARVASLNAIEDIKNSMRIKIEHKNKILNRERNK